MLFDWEDTRQHSLTHMNNNTTNSTAPDAQRTSTPLVNIIVLSWNGKNMTSECIDSILTNVTIPYELIVIDNGSTDGSAELLQERYGSGRIPNLRIVLNAENRGFAGGNNQGFTLANGNYVLLLNNDTIIHPGAIEDMVEFLESPEHAQYAAATCTLLNRDGSIQWYMHRRFPTTLRLCTALLYKRFTWFAPRPAKLYLYLDTTFTSDVDVEQAAGACLLLRKEFVTSALHGELFDETHFPIYYNDVDLCYRILRAGRSIRCLTAHPITHLKGASVRRFSFTTNSKYYTVSSLSFFRKHHQWVDYAALKCLYLLLFAFINVCTPLLLLLKKIDRTQAVLRWNILTGIVRT